LLSDLTFNPEAVAPGVPAKDFVVSRKKSLHQTLVSCAGGVSIIDQARIMNWMHTHIAGKNREAMVHWAAKISGAHAITIFLANWLYQEAARHEKLEPNQTVNDFLKPAWDLQELDKDLGDDPMLQIDVDAECIRKLELEMYQCSAASGEAGFHQWGLDVSEHQERWNPWAGTDWFDDYYPYDESLIEVRLRY
jgi:hypothetical protein